MAGYWTVINGKSEYVAENTSTPPTRKTGKARREEIVQQIEDKAFDEAATKAARRAVGLETPAQAEERLRTERFNSQRDAIKEKDKARLARQPSERDLRNARGAVQPESDAQENSDPKV